MATTGYMVNCICGYVQTYTDKARAESDAQAHQQATQHLNVQVVRERDDRRER